MDIGRERKTCPWILHHVIKRFRQWVMRPFIISFRRWCVWIITVHVSLTLPQRQKRYASECAWCVPLYHFFDWECMPSWRDLAYFRAFTFFDTDMRLQWHGSDLIDRLSKYPHLTEEVLPWPCISEKNRILSGMTRRKKIIYLKLRQHRSKISGGLLCHLSHLYQYTWRFQ